MIKKIFITALLASALLTCDIYAYDLAEAECRIEEEKSMEYQNLCEDCLTVAYVVHAEAGNQGFIGKCLVASVIKNRIADPRFPDTIKDVINQEGQFNVMKNGAFEKAKTELDMESYAAAWSVFMDKTDYDNDILYFSRGKGPGTHFYKWKDHWFSY